uniref:BTB domain-containing protein n=1 Tax=Panagrolaimus superbus TaxID=310955 RepID=A0A914YG27_9BILA
MEPVKFDKIKNEFVVVKHDEKQKQELCDFAISINAECKKVDFEETIVRIPYTLFIPDYNLRDLNVYEYLEGVICLQDGLKFTYYVNKSKEDKVEIIVKNEYLAEISDKKSENQPLAKKQKTFRHQACDFKDLELTLWFMFNKADIKSLKLEKENDKIIDKNQEDEKDEECLNEPDFVMLKNNTAPKSMKKLSLYDVMSDTKYSDVIFIASNGVEVPSYRCILSKYSKYLADHFEETKLLPVKINAEEFTENTIKAAIEFCNGKNNASTGKEIVIYDFAEKFCFEKLKEICLLNIESQLNLENVYEVIKIAYSKDLDSLKKLCTEIMRENKGNLDPSKLFKLPRKIGDDLNLFTD